MFFHSMKYTFLELIRDKSSVFWCFAFPLLLGTLFNFAFGGLGADESFSPIAVAVVMDESADEEYSLTMLTEAASAAGLSMEDFGFLEEITGEFGMSLDSDSTFRQSDSIRKMFDTLSEPGEDQFLVVTYATEEEAQDLLEKKEVYGIINVDMPDMADYFTANDSTKINAAPLTLTISAEMNSDPLYQSILSCFVEQYNIQYSAISEIAMENPMKLPELMNSMNLDTEYIHEQSLGASSLDEASTYFFNLIAMTCLFASMAGSNVAIHNQANLSPLGARRNVSPVHRLVSILGDLSAVLIYEFMTLLVALVYFTTVLGIDFGTQFGFVVLTALCGCLTGISFGFFVGSIGHFSQNTKMGILIAVSMVFCFLSGLMVGNMRILVDQICPLLNRINPAAIISDALYSLAIYPSHDRFFMNIGSLLVISALFCLGGFAMVRRKKYASL